jgi:hypothetical protein
LNRLKNCLIAGVLATCAIETACGPIHEWPYADGPYCGAEFCVDLPGKGGASVKWAGNGAYASVDLIDDSSNWFSVEWWQSTQLRDADPESFYRHWDGSENSYLSGNFGEARYELIGSKHITLGNGQPGVAFAGSGWHNGGKKGAVIIIASRVDGHTVTSYLLLDRQLAKGVDLAENRSYRLLLSVAASVRAK